MQGVDLHIAQHSFALYRHRSPHLSGLCTALRCFCTPPNCCTTPQWALHATIRREPRSSLHTALFPYCAVLFLTTQLFRTVQYTCANFFALRCAFSFNGIAILHYSVFFQQYFPIFFSTALFAVDCTFSQCSTSLTQCAALFLHCTAFFPQCKALIRFPLHSFRYVPHSFRSAPHYLPHLLANALPQVYERARVTLPTIVGSYPDYAAVASLD